MAEANGDRETRLDHIERALELLIADHEQFRADHKQLLIAQALQKKPLKSATKSQGIHKVDRTASCGGVGADRRIRDLVSAIGN